MPPLDVLNERGRVKHFAPGPELPPRLWEPIKRFLLDGKTGNVKLSIKDGRILSCRLEEYVTVSDKPRQ